MQISIDDMPVITKSDGLENRTVEWNDLLVRYLVVPPNTDWSEWLQGLPDDVCSCSHWGWIVSGSVHTKYADGTVEVARAGDLYYWPAGHTGWTEEGVTFIEFSRTAELKPVLRHVARHLASKSDPSGGSA